MLNNESDASMTDDKKQLSRQEKIERKIQAQNAALDTLYGESFKRITLDDLEKVSPKFVELVRTYLRPYPTRDNYDKKF